MILQTHSWAYIQEKTIIQKETYIQCSLQHYLQEPNMEVT